MEVYTTVDIQEMCEEFYLVQWEDDGREVLKMPADMTMTKFAESARQDPRLQRGHYRIVSWMREQEASENETLCEVLERV